MMLDGVTWVALPDAEPGPDGTPHVTAEGVLELGGGRLRCYQLSDGRRIFDAEDVWAFFDGFAP
jgi:hypothetical protein